jgi:serine/threonine protein kinase
MNKLGAGGFGSTWLYQSDSDADEYAAIKFLGQSPLSEPRSETVDRFRREGKIMKSLQHESIAKLKDSDIDCETPWIAMEYFAGEDLRRVLVRRGALEQREWFRLASEMLNALAYMHQNKVIHRDLNPGNIMSTDYGYKIIDLGIARQQATFGAYHSPVYHRYYPSPEQSNEEALTVATDVFTLASVLVLAGTKLLPWSENPEVLNDRMSASIAQEVREGVRTRKPMFHNLSQAQREFLTPLFEKDPAKRITASEASDLLKKIITKNYVAPAQPGSQRPRPIRTRSSVPAKRPPVKKAAAVPPRVQPRPTPVAPQVTPPKPAPKPIPQVNVAASIPPLSRVEKIMRELLIFAFATPFGWLAYRSLRKSKRYGTKLAPLSKRARNFFIFFYIYHTLQIGFTTLPLVWFVFAKRRKPLLLAFAIVMTVTTVITWQGFITTPNNGTLPALTAVAWIANVLLGYAFPTIYRLADSFDAPVSAPQAQPQTQQEQVKVEPTPTPTAAPIETPRPVSEGRDPVIDETDALSEPSNSLPSWDAVELEILKVLRRVRGSGVEVSIKSPFNEGIFFTGAIEENGYATMELASKSVSPSITRDQNRNIIRCGWEPPVGDSPNYIKFLDLIESNYEFMAKIATKTLREGFGLPLAGLDVGIMVKWENGEYEICRIDDIQPAN